MHHALHWRRLVPKYWVGKPKYWGGQKMVKSDKCMGVSQLLEERARVAPPKSTPMMLYTYWTPLPEICCTGNEK